MTRYGAIDYFKSTIMDENQLSKLIMADVLAIHRQYGPGIFESVYEKILMSRLSLRGLSVRRQVPIYLSEVGFENELAFKIDLLVENKVILELESVESIVKVHRMQLLTYLRLAEKKLGLLINFNTDYVLKNGFERVVNGL